MSEEEAMASCFAKITRRITFENARRMAATRHKREPNWVFAMELFGLGSTYAWAMCLDMGIDPDAKSVSPPRALSTSGALNMEH